MTEEIIVHPEFIEHTVTHYSYIAVPVVSDANEWRSGFFAGLTAGVVLFSLGVLIRWWLS